MSKDTQGYGNPVMEYYRGIGAPIVVRKKTHLRILLGQIENKYNFPKAILDTDAFEYGYRTFLYNPNKVKNNGKRIGDIWLSHRWIENLTQNMEEVLGHIQLIVEYLGTPLKNKKVYAPVAYAPMHYLPTDPVVYLVLDENINYTHTRYSHKNYYKEIKITDEKTIGDLYINAWKYQYEPTTDTFIRLPTKGAIVNALNGYMQSISVRYGGSIYDRISDMSRLILYLYSKVALTDKEKELLKPMLAEIENTNDIAHIAQREGILQSYIRWIKNNPEEFVRKQRDINEEEDEDYEWWV
ncbi:MAG: hypothetical protein RR203_02545 [Synergistaceae bacterium]